MESDAAMARNLSRRSTRAKKPVSYSDDTAFAGLDNEDIAHYEASAPPRPASKRSKKKKDDDDDDVLEVDIVGEEDEIVDVDDLYP